MRSRRRVILAVVAAVAVVVAALVIYQAVRGPTVKVKTAEVYDTGLERKVSASGVVQSTADYDVYAPVQGTVDKLYVKDQERVHYGDKLVLIDQEPFEIAVAQAEAALAQANASGHSTQKTEPTCSDYRAADQSIAAAWKAWDIARKKLKAMEPETVIGPTGIVKVPADKAQLQLAEEQSYASYLAAKAQKQKLYVASDTGPEMAAAGASADQAQLALDKARHDLAATRVSAPISGVVFLDNLSGTALQGPTRKLTAGQAVTPATPLARIVDPARMKFVADVDEADVAQVVSGQKARVTLDAYEGTTVYGVVTRVAILSKTTQSGGSAFAVDIALPKRKRGLRVGMNGTADVIITKRASALQVPIEAVTQRDGKDVVFVVANGVADLREVRLGFATDTVYEIKKGVKSGEVVATSGLDQLKDGTRVQAQ